MSPRWKQATIDIPHSEPAFNNAGKARLDGRQPHTRTHKHLHGHRLERRVGGTRYGKVQKHVLASSGPEYPDYGESASLAPTCLGVATGSELPLVRGCVRSWALNEGLAQLRAAWLLPRLRKRDRQILS
ncbi:unnamed protein product [Protopolystoma xenopodis]|uniref:Uncharacterized protein n=1 Tax=Protopolystoma xenopodis TaxID=117903 RepID=A0A3S4ZVZ7_9PLAT|nr:unnamed protein product [Protopolystoma xenopodis]